MNFEVLKQISEYFYVDFKDITDGIKTKNENINNKFRIAFEELLCQINNVYSFIPDGSSFYNRIVNNYDFQMHMINKYKCDSKLMGCLRKIQKLGNETTHNSLKVFDENDVRDSFLRLLILSRKILAFERNGLKLDFTSNQIYEEFDKLINYEIENKEVKSKEKFIETIKSLDEKLVLETINIYTNSEKKDDIIDDFKQLISITLNYILSFNPKYLSLEDLKISKYSDLYKAYNNIENIKNYDDIEDVVASLIDYSYIIRDILSLEFNIEILDWIFSIKNVNFDEDNSSLSEFEQIAYAIDECFDNTDDNVDVNGVVYYVESQRQFIINNKKYYTVNLKKALKDNAKSNTVYSKNKLPDNYALEISLKSKDIKLLDNNIPVYVVKDYKIAIRPCEIKWLVYAITGEKIKISKNSNFYKTFMNYLNINKCTIYDILTAKEKKYQDFMNQFNGIIINDSNIFEKAMNKARQILVEDEFESGANLLRYFTNKLNNTVLRDQISNSDKPFKNLYFSNGSYRFDRNPFSFSLVKHNIPVKELYHYINNSVYEEDILVRKMNNKMIEDETLFIDGKIYGDDVAEKIDKYNSYIENFNYDNSGKIGNINNYYYKEENIKCINSILDQLILKTKFSEFNYKEMSTKIIEKGIDSKNKKDILINSFNNSSIALIMGEAGTGKTELLCNYYVNIFKGMKILFISNTHTCKNNMIRRVKEKSEWYEEKYEAKTASSISKNKYFFGEYDLVIIDECKSISNRDINEILKKINTKYLILAGDIGQIDAIDLGNWFDIAAQMLDNKDIFVLTENYRTNSNELRNVWEKVRNKEADTLEYLLKNNYIEMINSNIFNKTSDDEIILCLNYNGTFGITSINSYFQNQNPHEAVKNNLDCYKVGDPVVFNENANNKELYGEYLYNNLKGIIRKIVVNGEYLEFEIKVETYIPLSEMNVISSNKEEDWSIIKVKFKKYVDKPEDENEEEYQSPFAVTYALSIHKAQGLEYSSVKIIITPEGEEKINNRVFYTAITRAKDNLKIYLTRNNQENMLNILTEKDDRKDVELLKIIRGDTNV